MDTEEWRAVVGWEGLYEVSSLGRVRNIQGHLMKPWVNNGGYNQIGLSGRGAKKQRLVHRLVCEAFHGPPPAGAALALHGPGGLQDNSVKNLYWGDNGRNMRDRQRDGTDPNASKTQCPQGHPYSKENTRVAKMRGSRRCRICERDSNLRFVGRVSGTEPPKHGTMTAYTAYKCRCPECRTVNTEYQRQWSERKQERGRGDTA